MPDEDAMAATRALCSPEESCIFWHDTPCRLILPGAVNELLCRNTDNTHAKQSRVDETFYLCIAFFGATSQ